MSKSKQKKGLEPLDSGEIAKVNEALIARFGVQLRPGESLSLDVERSQEHALATLSLSNADDSFQLELEAAVLETDEAEETKVNPASRHLIAVDYLDTVLEEYFSADRHYRFHDDWRVVDFESTAVRFRGVERRPHLEATADAWLEAGGDPDALED